jgi:hypothetical protein
MTNLNSYLTNFTSGGTWTVVSYPSTIPVIVSDVVNFVSLPSGDYVFRYTVSTLTCNESTDITIKKFGVALSNQTVSCTKSLNLYSVVENTPNTMDVFLKNNTQYIYGKLNSVVTDTCTNQVIKQQDNEFESNQSYRGKVYLKYTIPLTTGTYIKSMQFIDTTSNTVNTFDLNPTTTSYLNPALPCSTSVTQSELYVGQLTFFTSLRNLIRNALCSFYGATINDSDITCSSVSGNLEIKIACNYNANYWVGTTKTATLIYNNGLDVNITPVFDIEVCAISIIENVNCSLGLTTTPFVNFTIDENNTNYNNIVLLNSKYLITGSLTTPVLTTTCNNFVLTMTPNTECNYKIVTWYKGTDIIAEQVDSVVLYNSAVNSGTYTVDVKCNSCTTITSITI